jgi:hypothetical protein
MRPGPRTFLVRIGTPEHLDIVTRWARGGRAPHEVVPTELGPVVRVYLLPTQLGGHPLQAFQRPISLANVAPAERTVEQQPAV